LSRWSCGEVPTPRNLIGLPSPLTLIFGIMEYVLRKMWWYGVRLAYRAPSTARVFRFAPTRFAQDDIFRRGRAWRGAEAPLFHSIHSIVLSIAALKRCATQRQMAALSGWQKEKPSRAKREGWG
jgi:hypothetical protein